jgi:hypothetical protein
MMEPGLYGISDGATIEHPLRRMPINFIGIPTKLVGTCTFVPYSSLL